MRIYLDNFNQFNIGDEVYVVYCSQEYCSIERCILATTLLNDTFGQYAEVRRCDDKLTTTLNLEKSDECGDLEAYFTTLEEAEAHMYEFRSAHPSPTPEYFL